MAISREYELLRAEIKSEYDYIQGNNTIIYTATGGILTFALGTMNTNCFVCLLPLFIILSLYLRNVSHHRSVIRNATYLYVFWEGDEFNWERRHYKFDKTHNQKLNWLDPLRYYTLVLLCGGAAFCKIIESDNAQCVIEKTIIIIFFCLFSLYEIRAKQVNYLELGETYIARWKSIKKEEKAMLSDVCHE